MNNQAEWKFVKLKDVSYIISGGTPPRKNSWYYAKEGLPWAKIENLDQGEIYDTTEYLSGEGEKEINTIPAESILVSVIGTIGKIGIAGRDMATNQQILSIVFKKDANILQKYGYYYFIYSRERIKKMAYSTVAKRVTKGTLEQMIIPVPSKEIQGQIVKDLELAEAYLLKKREMFTLLQAFEEGFSTHICTPEDWHAIATKTGWLKEAITKSIADAGLLLSSLFYLIFDECEKRKNRCYYEGTEYIQADGYLKKLTALQKIMLEQMSDFQQALYREFYKQERASAIHQVLKEIKAKNENFSEYHIQDAVMSVEVLRELGFLQMQEEQILYYPQEEGTTENKKPEDRKQEIKDEDGNPVGIEMWNCLFNHEEH